MGTAACTGKGFKKRIWVSGERPIGATRKPSMQASSPPPPHPPYAPLPLPFFVHPLQIQTRCPSHPPSLRDERNCRTMKNSRVTPLHVFPSLFPLLLLALQPRDGGEAPDFRDSLSPASQCWCGVAVSIVDHQGGHFDEQILTGGFSETFGAAAAAVVVCNIAVGVTLTQRHFDRVSHPQALVFLALPLVFALPFLHGPVAKGGWACST